MISSRCCRRQTWWTRRKASSLTFSLRLTSTKSHPGQLTASGKRAPSSVHSPQQTPVPASTMTPTWNLSRTKSQVAPQMPMRTLGMIFRLIFPRRGSRIWNPFTPSKMTHLWSLLQLTSTSKTEICRLRRETTLDSSLTEVPHPCSSWALGFRAVEIEWKIKWIE